MNTIPCHVQQESLKGGLVIIPYQLLSFVYAKLGNLINLDPFNYIFLWFLPLCSLSIIRCIYSYVSKALYDRYLSEYQRGISLKCVIVLLLYMINIEDSQLIIIE